MRVPAVYLVYLLAVFYLIVPSFAADAQFAYGRWAIITSAGQEETALGELVAAELTKVDDIELVEREQLHGIVNEQVLSTALSPEGAAGRLRIGAMLRADALLFVRMSGQGQARTVRIIAAECRSGTRLRVEELPWNMEKAPALAAHLRDLVVELRRQYPAGIERVVGVPGFISHSFSHDYDPLQTRYSELLQHLLMTRPGVVVLETAEARAIGKELALGGDTLAARPMPVFVQGEFRVEPRVNDVPLITLTVKLSDATRELDAVKSEPMPLDQAPRWITATLPAKVLAGVKNANPLTPLEQAQLLAEHADAFARLGAFDQSTALRESSLLLDPDRPTVRQSIIDEYYRSYYDTNYGFPLVFGYPENPEDPEFKAALKQEVDAYCTILEHIEYAIRHQQWNVSEIQLAFEVLSRWTISIHGNVRFALIRQAGWGYLDEAEKERKRFIRAIWPSLVKIGGSSAVPNDQFQPFDPENMLLHNIAPFNIGAGKITPEDLDLLKQLLVEFQPDNYMLPGISTYFDAPDQFAVKIEDYLRFLNGLRESTNRIAHTYGEYLFLRYQVEQARTAKNHTALLSLCDSLRQLARDMDAIPTFSPDGIITRSFPISENIKALEKELGQVKEVPTTTAKTPSSALKLAKMSLKLKFSPDAPPSALNSLQEIGDQPQIIPCGKFDVIRAGNTLYLHRTAGLLEMLIIPGSYNYLHSVVWDGRWIWAGTEKREIWLFDSNGIRQTAFTAKQGLPGETYSLSMYPIAPGRVLAVGAAKDQRAWCAILSWSGKGSTPSVKPFHEASHVPLTDDLNARVPFFRDPAAGFTPGPIYPIQDGTQNHQVVVVRNYEGKIEFDHLKPLLIDLDRLKVNLWDFPEMPPIAQGRFTPQHITPKGVMIGFFEHETQIHNELGALLPASKEQPGPTYRTITVTNPGTFGNEWEEWQPELIGTRVPNAYFLPLSKAWVIVFSNGFWWRVNQSTLTAERLYTGQSPYQAGYSSLLGLVAWSQDGFFRVTIDETKIPAAGQ